MIKVKIGITGKGKKAIETELKLETAIPDKRRKFNNLGRVNNE